MKTCNIEDCTNKVGRHGARGYCSMHYKRLRNHGDPTIVTRVPRGASIEYILRFAGWQVTATGCWEFSGWTDPDGYGSITVNGAPYRAHRASHELWVGPIPAGHVVRHTCDQRMCINPSHLLTGMPADNTRDAVERQRMANGERHGMHKLRDDEVNDMRHEYARGGITQRELARRYGCSQSQVNNVLLRKQRADETHILAA